MGYVSPSTSSTDPCAAPFASYQWA
jgi:hypothetical protein